MFHWCKLTLELQSDVIDECKGSRYGCCPDGITIATTADLFGCPGKYSGLGLWLLNYNYHNISLSYIVEMNFVGRRIYGKPKTVASH